MGEIKGMWTCKKPNWFQRAFMRLFAGMIWITFKN